MKSKENMNKKLVFASFLSCLFCSAIKPMAMPQLIPSEFTLKTALDYVSVPKISQTALGLASIGMFYKACDLWAQASTPFPPHLQGIVIQDKILDTVTRGRKMAALKCFLSGSAFATAAMLITYGPALLKRILCR